METETILIAGALLSAAAAYVYLNSNIYWKATYTPPTTSKSFRPNQSFFEHPTFDKFNKLPLTEWEMIPGTLDGRDEEIFGFEETRGFTAASQFYAAGWIGDGKGTFTKDVLVTYSSNNVAIMLNKDVIYEYSRTPDEMTTVTVRNKVGEVVDSYQQSVKSLQDSLLYMGIDLNRAASLGTPVTIGKEKVIYTRNIIMDTPTTKFSDKPFLGYFDFSGMLSD